MQHMTPDKVCAIAAFLDARRPTFYSGYPSIIHAFAQCLIDANEQLQSPPRFVFTGAENMLDFQRTAIERVTGALLSDQYGFAEGCGNASHCTALRYHEDFEYGVLECADGAVADADGAVRGKILATGFASPVFPFIRYEIGDVGLWQDAATPCSCGRKSRVLIRIEGRADDYVVTPEGRHIMRFDYLFKDTPHVRESQVVQDAPGQITVRIVRRPSYSMQDEDRIRKDVARWISPLLKVNFEYLAEIPRDGSGKFRAVKSTLAGAHGQPLARRDRNQGVHP
jgi:phenylacetate-CoA ligase